jgi:cobaltochelatase CobN
LSPEVQAFLEQSNPWALHTIADRLLEAVDRNLWKEADPRTVAELRNVRLKAESFVEERSERPGVSA